MTSHLPAYRLFEVTGIELEYPIVDPELQPRPLVEDLFRFLAGRPTSEVERHKTIFSNELAAHVFEIKTAQPERNLAAAERQLMDGLRAVIAVLRERFGARLLPTGMHPFMRPSQGRLWPRAGRAIYETYAKLFATRTHGWMNVQSSHVNLPFGTEEQTVRLHNAISCLLPYLPALAASSPVYSGRLGPFVDNRLAFYRTNQKRIPRITGKVVPEFMTSYAQYRREILGAIYQDLDQVQGAGRLRHEWINSRGAIVRFNRRAIEIRVLDVQECVKMDIAIAVFLRGVLKRMVRWLGEERLLLPKHGMLVEDFNRVVKQGSRAEVSAAHLRPWLGRAGRKILSRDVLLALFEECEEAVPAPERPYLPLIERRLQRESLSETIRREISRRSARGGDLSGTIRGIYEELAGCLENNRPWKM